MNRPRGLARLLSGAGLGIVLVGALATPVAAVDPILGRPIPAEPEAVTLPFPVNAAMVADIGAGPQLLVVTSSDTAFGLAAVQVWTVGSLADGAAGISGGNKVGLRRTASVDEQLSGRGRLGIVDGMIAVRMSEPAKFIRWHRDGREVPLIATIGTELDPAVGDVPFGDVPCCLTIWEPVLKGDRLSLERVASTSRLGVQLISADMDADGTDELFVTEGPPATSDESPPLDAAVLRWDGDQFARDAFTIPSLEGCCATVLDAGETDGVPGNDILVTGSDGFQSSVVRVTLRGGTPYTEQTEIGEIAAARVVALEHGPSLVTSDGFGTVVLWGWRRDEQARQLGTRVTGGSPVAVFGRGPNTRLLVGSGDSLASILVLTGDLQGGPAVFGRDTRAGAFTGTVLGDAGNEATLFHGQVPGGLPGMPDAYIFSGRLIRPDYGPDEVLATAESIGLLPSLEPIGAIGPGGERLALLGGFIASGSSSPAIELLGNREPSTLSLVATASVLSQEIDGAHLSPTFYGVAQDPQTEARELIVGDEAADAEIRGPVGTVVTWVSHGEQASESIPESGSLRIRLLEPAGPDAPDGSGTTVIIWAVTPAGHAYSATWRIRVFRKEPDLTVAEDASLVDFSPVVSGSTVPGATVTVNGQPVPVAATGSFVAPIDVGIVPTELRIVAVDPVGNRTERVVSRVWPFDYRNLPFVPIAVLLTILAAVLLFLRKPDVGPARRRPDEDATFEEIGGP